MIATISRHGHRQLRVIVPDHATVSAATAERVSWHFGDDATLVTFDRGRKYLGAFRRKDGGHFEEA